MSVFFFFQAEDGIRDYKVTGVQTCALPICIRTWPGRCRTSAPPTWRGGRRTGGSSTGGGWTLSSARSEEHTSELQSPCNLVCRLLLEKKKKNHIECSVSDSDSALCADADLD